MADGLETRVRALLRVPPRPHPPAGAPESVRVFRAGRGFYRYRLLAWGWKQVSAVIGLALGIVFLREFSVGFEKVAGMFWASTNWFLFFESLAVGFFVVQLPVSFLLISLDYRYRWYMTTDRSLRIREGLWKIKERTVTYSNIQNVGIRQGPLQRFFGIADLEVRTAGGGGSEKQESGKSSADDLHVAYFRGVDNPTEIRDLILARLRRLRASGLGDPEEPETEVGGATTAARAPALAAAGELLREARLLGEELRAGRR